MEGWISEAAAICIAVLVGLTLINMDMRKYEERLNRIFAGLDEGGVEAQAQRVFYNEVLRHVKRISDLFQIVMCLIIYAVVRSVVI